MTLSIAAIIPARYASTRFPGKPLTLIQGKPMIQRVYEQVQHVKTINRIVVATDDERIAECVRNFGGEVVMTADDIPNGTLRCAAVLDSLNETFDYVINIQGDEPFIAPELIGQLVGSFAESPDIVTAVKRIPTADDLFNTNVVKAVLNAENEVLYFSRAAIPYQRDAAPETWLANADYYKHIGIYAFRESVLRAVATLPETPLENLEKLEQLRWLYFGYKIKAVVTTHESIGIDTPEDLRKIKDLL